MPSRTDQLMMSQASRALTDVSAHRRQHARTFLQLVMPLLVVTTWLLILIGAVWGQGAVSVHDVATVVGLTALTVGLVIAQRWFDGIRLAQASALGQVALLLYVVLTSDAPEQDSMYAIWPLIVSAYFGRPRTAALGGLTIGVALVLMGVLDPDWGSASPIPDAAYIITISGFLLAFVMREGRRVELALVSAMSRDRLALRLTRGIRLARDPRDAMTEIARSIGEATSADHALVALFEHDSDYVTDVVGWMRPDRDGTRSDGTLGLEPASIDATLRHLLITCFGAGTVGGQVCVLSFTGDGIEPEAEQCQDQSVTQSFEQLLQRVGATSGLIVPLPLGERAVGALLVACDDPHDWTSLPVPLLDQVAPQLAAGLAQVVLLRDQRDALEALERLDRMRDRLIANVSHELRTPLTSTIGFIETLMRTDIALSDEQRTQLMGHARDGGHRLLALVEDLLALGSTRPESLDLEPLPIRVSELVESTLLGIAPPSHRSLVVTSTEDAFVLVDRNRMLQVLSNLVMNAIHHGSGTIEVVSGISEGHAVIDVFDAGDGVADEHADELFHPFARFSTRPDSTGLGLAICRTIIEAHGGTIDYARTENGRTRFRTRLPMAGNDG